MVFRPLSPATKVGLESVWITVQVERQPLASSPPVLLLASSTSTFTVPVKAVSIAVRDELRAMMSRLAGLPAILVRSTPVSAPATVVGSKALKRPGGCGGVGGMGLIEA